MFSTDSSESKGVLADNKPQRDNLAYVTNHTFELSSPLGGRASIQLTPTCPIVLGSSQGAPRGAYLVPAIGRTPPVTPSIASYPSSHPSHTLTKTPQSSQEPLVLAVRSDRGHAKACPRSRRVGGDGATLGPVAFSGFRADPAL